MTEMMDRREQAIVEAGALYYDLRSRVVPSQLQGSVPNRGLIAWLGGYLERRLPTGQALTPILHLPGREQAALLEVLEARGPYRDDRYRLMVRVRNVGHRTLEVEIDHEWYPDTIRQDSAAAWVEGGTGRIVKQYSAIASGDELELPVSWAVHALLGLTYQGWPPAYWGASGAIPQLHELEEVGFTFRLDGQVRDSRDVVGVDGETLATATPPASSPAARRAKAS